ncbi:sulfurtransferase TusA family protein [Devosia sp. PTR5]|uniref:Sulfurtransferase TusA family protein n=1 Tax=Devosia oryzisoli TaxID=2774138 RepID=A0A927IS88_9HYPH|nr:sulfurtransferase TusA family protein [Devosia oryzisoli]MBD8064503.1 sulfurtransferase TusA family protein [Devosia oryzisoli]
MATDRHIDARGLKCPLPVLKLEKALTSAGSGQVLTLVATDPMVKVDIPLYCRQHAHTCEATEADGVFTFTIVVGNGR